MPANGLRLRFDGPEQRLRLIEVLDFNKITIMYNDKDIMKDGPWFKNLYHRVFGPTYAGEYIPDDQKGKGTYVNCWDSPAAADIQVAGGHPASADMTEVGIP